NLALRLQFSQCSDRSFKWYSRISSMKLIDIDSVHPEAPETSFNRFAQVLRTAVVCPLVRARAVPPALGCDHEVLRIRMQRLCNQVFAYVRPVRIRCVDEVDAQLHSAPKHRN